MGYFFVKFFGLGLDCFWPRSRTLGLEFCQSRSRSWSRKNYRVSVSEIFAKFVYSLAWCFLDNFFIAKFFEICEKE